MKTGIGQRASGIRNRKGWLRIIEVAFAAVLVFGFLIFVQTFEGGSRSSRPETDQYTLHQLGEDAIRSFDLRDADANHVNDLRWEILTNDWTDIGEYLNGTLESQISYALYYYNSSAGYDEGQVMFKTGSTSKPKNRDVSTVYYIIGGDDGRFCSQPSACALKLDLWYIR